MIRGKRDTNRGPETPAGNCLSAGLSRVLCQAPAFLFLTLSTMLARTRLQIQSSLKAYSRALASKASSVPAEKSGVPPAHPSTPTAQSPNYPQTWSTSQRPREDAYREARFEQTALNLQPQPYSAMDMIAQEPIRMVNGRKAVCDGGKICLSFDKNKAECPKVLALLAIRRFSSILYVLIFMLGFFNLPEH